MSLLPGQIIPATMPIGTVQPDGKSILVDKNWWLFFYNLYLHTTGSTSDDDSYFLSMANLISNPSVIGSGGFTNPMTTKGDMIYEDATPAPNRLPIGTPGQLLTVVSGLPAWSTGAVGISTLFSGAGNYTYTVPANATQLNITICGSGGSGGNGGAGTSTNPGGGGGGGIGGWTNLIIPAQLVPATLYIFLNIGTYSYVSCANDSSGLITGNTYAYATAGGNGANGSSTGPGSGGPAGAIPLASSAILSNMGQANFFVGQSGAQGQNSSTLNNISPTYGFITPGTGGGKPLNLSPPSCYGGKINALGGNSTVFTGQSGGAGGTSAGANGSRGSDGFAYFAGYLFFCGATGGGGGGYNGAGADGVGGAGGNAGSTLGCGGGGGGAGSTGGAGGTGGAPFCLIQST